MPSGFGKQFLRDRDGGHCVGPIPAPIGVWMIMKEIAPSWCNTATTHREESDSRTSGLLFLNEKSENGEPPAHSTAHFRIYDLRHAFWTRLGESDADAYTIMKLMGHGSITISCRYVHPTPERLENAGLADYNKSQASKPAIVTRIDKKTA